MKKTMKCIAMLLTLVMALGLLAGCGEQKTKKVGGEVTNLNQDDQSAGNTDAKTDDTKQDTKAEVDVEATYSFASNGVVFTVDMLAADIIAALGEPTSYFEAPSCAFNGLDKTYSYPDFQIETYEGEGGDRISTIILVSDLVSTREGVCIGDDASVLADKYPAATAEEDTMVKYEKNGVCLLFILEDGVISSIQYSMSED